MAAFISCCASRPTGVATESATHRRSIRRVTRSSAASTSSASPRPSSRATPNDDQILVELPGVAGRDRAKQIIKSTAQLRLTLVERGPFPDRAAALQSYGNACPALEVLAWARREERRRATAYYVVHKTPAVTGNDLRDARQSTDEYNRPAVSSR